MRKFILPDRQRISFELYMTERRYFLLEKHFALLIIFRFSLLNLTTSFAPIAYVQITPRVNETQDFASESKYFFILLSPLIEKSYICSRNLKEVKTRAEYIQLIKDHTKELKTLYGVTSLRIFGSVAREQHNENSDVDVCVEMPPRIFKLIGLGTYLEDLLGCHVDVIREHNNMNAFLRKEIEKDGIYVFN